MAQNKRSGIKTQPLNPNHSLESMFEARFLKAWHLLDRGATEFTDIIKAVTKEQLGNPQDNKWGSVLYFTSPRIPAPYLLGTKEDLETLLEIYAVRTIGQLIGLRVTIHVAHWQGKDVLRIKPKLPGAAGAAPAVATAETPDDADEDSEIYEETEEETDEEQDNDQDE